MAGVNSYRGNSYTPTTPGVPTRTTAEVPTTSPGNISGSSTVSNTASPSVSSAPNQTNNAATTPKTTVYTTNAPKTGNVSTPAVTNGATSTPNVTSDVKTHQTSTPMVTTTSMAPNPEDDWLNFLREAYDKACEDADKAYERYQLLQKAQKYIERTKLFSATMIELREKRDAYTPGSYYYELYDAKYNAERAAYKQYNDQTPSEVKKAASEHSYNATEIAKAVQKAQKDWLVLVDGVDVALRDLRSAESTANMPKPEKITITPNPGVTDNAPTPGAPSSIQTPTTGAPVSMTTVPVNTTPEPSWDY